MKKVLLFIVLLLGYVTTQAQMATVNIPVGQSFVDVQTNYTLSNAVVQYLLVKAPQHNVATQDFLVNLDSLAGDHTNVAVALYGRKFDTAAWTAIGSAVNWKGTTSSHDTTIVISNATGNRYRDYKIQYTGTGTGTTTIDVQQLKLYFQN